MDEREGREGAPVTGPTRSRAVSMHAQRSLSWTLYAWATTVADQVYGKANRRRGGKQVKQQGRKDRKHEPVRYMSRPSDPALQPNVRQNPPSPVNARKHERWWGDWRGKKARYVEVKGRTKLRSERILETPHTYIRQALPGIGDFTVLRIERIDEYFLMHIMFSDGSIVVEDKVDDFPSELLLAKIMLLAG